MIVNPPFGTGSGGGPPPPPVGTTLDPAYLGPRLSLSNGNLTGTAQASPPQFASIALATTGRSTGKWYFESNLNVSAGPNNEGWGVATHAAPLFAFLGFDCNSIGARTNLGQVARCGSVIVTLTGLDGRSTDFLQCAVDAGAQLIWFAGCDDLGNNFSGWNPTLGGNPATGAGGIDISQLGGGPYYPALSFENATEWTINFGATPFTISPPSGFTAWGS